MSPIAMQQTLVELVRLRAQQQPKQRAYTFLLDGETEAIHLTYQELDRQARAIAATLQNNNCAGERALLLYQPGLDYISAFFGCLYAGVIAVPAYPPHPNRPMPRLRAIVQDAQASLLLMTTQVRSQIEARLADHPELQTLRCLTSDTIEAGVEAGWQPPRISGDTLAFLQYTSGSTAAPKGVMLTHANLLHNLATIQVAFEFTPQSHMVTWLPPYHDMGLIGGILQPLYAGFSATLMAPVMFLQRPLRWLQAISRYGADTSGGGPNFAYELCVLKTTPEQRKSLDLSNWSIAYNGAEPVRAETIARFIEAFAPCGFRPSAFYPCYGLAESSLFVTGGRKAAAVVTKRVRADALERHQVVELPPAVAEGRTLVGSGHPWLDHQVVIVDPETGRRCPPDQVGEIWVSGGSIAQGYWQRPDESAHTFRATLADSAGGPFLRTGDLGFLSDGELFVAGRMKDLLIINGHNHYPQDIELTVEQSHPAVRTGCCAAFSADINGCEQLVVVAEIDRHHRPQRQAGGDAEDAKALIQAIRRAVTRHHDLQAYAIVLIKTGSLPKTSSGKIQRYACRKAFLTDELEVWGQERTG